MDTVKDLKVEITKKYLKKALGSMSKEIRLNVLNFMKELKSTTTVISISNEEFLESESTDSMMSDHQVACAENSNEYYSNNGDDDE